MTLPDGVCIYCWHVTGNPPKSCRITDAGKDYGHDYSYDEAYVKAIKDAQEANHLEYAEW